jgi:hypothetical protein
MDKRIENLSSARNNTFFEVSQFEKKGIFSWLDYMSAEEILQEKQDLTREFEKTLTFQESEYEWVWFLKGFFRKAGSEASLYHKIIEWNLEVKSIKKERKFLIEDYTPENIRDRVYKELLKKKTLLSSYAREERRQSFQEQTTRTQSEDSQRNTLLREKNEKAKQNYLYEISEKITNIEQEIGKRNEETLVIDTQILDNFWKDWKTTENEIKKLVSRKNTLSRQSQRDTSKILFLLKVQEELEKKTPEIKTYLFDASDRVVLELGRELLEMKETLTLLEKLPTELRDQKSIDIAKENIRIVERLIIQEIQEVSIKDYKKILLKKKAKNEDQSTKQILSIQFLLIKLWFYDALTREREKISVQTRELFLSNWEIDEKSLREWGKSPILNFLRTHNNPQIQDAFRKFLWVKTRRDGSRISGVLDNETLLAFTYLQYQNLWKDTKNADGIPGPKSMEIIIKHLESRKI